MSRSVIYSVLIRDGQKRCFADVWGTLHRELFWGAEAFEGWLSQGEETEDEPEELSGAVIVNFDRREMRWGEREVLDLPRVQAVYQRLLEASWPGFTITALSSSEIEAEVRGINDDKHADEHPDGDDENDVQLSGDRPATVREAAGFSADEEDESEDEDDEPDNNPDDMIRAWLTIVDQNGKVRQRVLELISADLIAGVKTAVQDLAKLKAVEVPPEKSVLEGMWINLKDKEIGVWGGQSARRDFPRLQQAWSKWNVHWAVNGYADQCSVGGLPGIAMTDAEALAKFIPQVLSVKKFDVMNLAGALGGSLRKTAIKATGCLLIVLAVPVLLAGFFMDKLKEAGYTVAALVVIAAIAFKVVELKVRSRFRKSPFSSADESADTKPAVAGPLDETDRRRSMDRILNACGFPSLKELEPHFPKAPSLEELM